MASANMCILGVIVPEDELHQAEDSDLLAQLVNILRQGRLRVQNSLVFVAQLIILVQVTIVEALQHLFQPSVVLGSLQHLNL